MIKINLVSEGRRPVVARKAKEALGVGQTSLAEGLFLIAIVVGLIAIGLTWWIYRGRIQQRDTEIAAAQKEVDELQLVLKEVEDFKAKKAELEHKIEVINDLKQKQWGPVRIMDQISRALPELLWLDQMRLRNNNVELRGRAFNTNQVATFIENLDKVPEFQEPRLLETTKQGPVYSFAINFNFSLPKPEKPASSTDEGIGRAGCRAG